MSRSPLLKASKFASTNKSLLLDPGSISTSAPEPAEPVQAGRWITESELERLAREWHARGLEEGRSALMAQCKDEARTAARRDFAQELDAAKAQLSRECAEQMKSLALALAEQLQVMRVSLEAQLVDWTFVACCRLLGELAPTRVRSTALQVLQDAGQSGPVIVLLHPQDHALIGLFPLEDAAVDIVWRADPGITLGGCKILTQDQTLDARLDVQLELLRQALNEARQQACVGEGEKP